MVFTLLGGLGVGIALLAAEGRNQQMYDYSVNQQRILAEFTQQLPAFDDRALILICDQTNALKKTQLIIGTNTGSKYLEYALQYLYHDYHIHAWLCYPGELEAGAFPERCEVDGRGVHLFWNAVPTQYYPYNQVIAFNYDAASGDMNLLDKLPDVYFGSYPITTYEPYKLINASAPPPARVKTLLANWSMKTSPVTALVQPN